jgi:hypothetical protein
VLPLLFICPLALLAQAKNDTEKYIIDEIKSLESRNYFIRDIAFSPSGDTLTLVRGRSDKAGDKGTVIPLAKVDIYCVTVHRANGIDHYNLVARSRGREGNFILNGVKFNGVTNLVGMVQDERKAKALEKAFNRLTVLTTGRKELFPIP